MKPADAIPPVAAILVNDTEDDAEPKEETGVRDTPDVETCMTLQMLRPV
jgi:hypothetical protein